MNRYTGKGWQGVTAAGVGGMDVPCIASVLFKIYYNYCVRVRE